MPRLSGFGLFCGILFVAALPAQAQVVVGTFITGQFQRYSELSGAAQGNLGSGTGGAAGIAGLTRGPDGFYYASTQSFIQSNDAILRIHPTTGAASTFVTLPVGYSPSALRFGPDGDLYVAKYVGQTASFGSGSIDRFHGTNGTALGSVVTGLTQPTGLAFLGNDILISNQGEGNVKRFSAGNLTTLIANQSGGLLAPNGLTVGPNGNVFVVDLFGGEIKHYTPAGTPIGTGTFASGASLTGQFPSDLLFDDNGKLWVANLGASFNTPTGSVVRFDASTGAFLDTVDNAVHGASVFAFTPVPEPAFALLLAPIGLALRRRKR
jgi:hypothetical protein